MNTKVLITNNNDESLRQLAHQLEHHGMPREAQIIYQGRNTIGVVDGRCIKSFKKPGLLKGFIYNYFRLPKAERAFFAGTKLNELGIRTPEPRALVICKHNGQLERSYYVCDYYEGWTTLRGVEARKDFGELAKALATFMKEIHSKGVYFKDFSQGNVLFRKTSEGFEFAVVDINRIRFDVTDRTVLLDSFGKVLDTREGMKQLAEEYAKGTPYAAEDLVDIYDRTQRRLFRNKHIKNFFRKNKR